MPRGQGRGRLEARQVRGKRHWVGVWSDHEGRRRYRNFGPNKALAEKLLAAEVQRRDLLKAGLVSEAGRMLTLRDVVEHRLRQMELQDRSPSSIRSERVDLENFIRYAPAETVGDLSLQTVTAFQATRKKQGASNRTINKQVAAMARALKHGVRMGMLGANPFADAPMLPVAEKHQRKRRRPLTDDETRRLLEAVSELDKASGKLPYRPFFEVALLTGARVGELLACDWAHYDPEAQLLHLRASTRKQGTRHLAFLGDAGCASLDALRGATVDLLAEDLPDLTPIFRGRTGLSRASAHTLLKVFHQACEMAGVPRYDAEGRSVDLHALRGTYASRMAEAGVDLGVLQKLMGHSTPALTARHYARPSFESLVRAARRSGALDAVSAAIRSEDR